MRPTEATLLEAAEVLAAILEANGADAQMLLAQAPPDVREQVQRLLPLAEAAERFLEHIPVRYPGTSVLPPGTRVGHFTIGALLARGGMGVVYRASQDHPAREVALKVLATPFPSAGAARRFHQESVALAKLRHPGIAAIHAAGTFEVAGHTLPYFAMELVEGQPITDATRSMSLHERLELLAQVCDAVEHSHQRGIVHRDLKPSNILVGLDGRARVLDFGIAKLLSSDRTEAVTAEGDGIVGTPAYMSPEQVAGGDLDTRSDVYSLGLIAAEVLTGRSPYVRVPANLIEAAEIVRRGELIRPSRLDPALRGDPEAVLLAALDLDPTCRHQSAGAFATDLRRIVRHEHVSVRPLTAAYLLRVFVRRHRALVGLTAAGVFVLTAGIAATTWQAIRASRAESRAIHRSDELAALCGALLEFSNSIVVQSGSMKARGAILEKVLPALNSLAAANPEEVPLQRTLGRAYAAMAAHLGFVHTSSLGRYDDAVAAAQKALAIFDRVGADNEEQPAGLCLSIAEALAINGKYDQAEPYYIQGHQKWLGLARSQPENMERWYAAVFSVEWRARALANANRPQEAASLALTAPSILEPVASFVPRDAASAHSLSSANISVAACLRIAEDHHSAVPYLVAARDLAARAVALDPGDIQWVGGLGGACRHLGRCLVEVQRAADAVDVLQQSVECYMRVSAARPGDGAVADVCALAFTDLAGAYVAARRFPEAIQAAEEGVARQSVLIAADPESMHPINNGCLQAWAAASALRAASTEEGIDPAERTARRSRALYHIDVAIALADRMKPVDSAQVLLLKQRLAQTRVELLGR